MYDDIIIGLVFFLLFTVFYMKLVYELIDTMLEKNISTLWIVFSGLFLFLVFIFILALVAFI
ncbi:hypothetical protein [Staphylococcus phage Stab22]|nr:putative membrane protein [Staphylococcus phage Stab22]VEV89540.1 hypothetical protein [Staphylococcus phage Stab22]